MADSPHRAGTGKDEGRKKRRPSSTGDSEDAQQEESPAAGPEEESPAAGPEEEATGPEEAHRPPPLYGYDPDQWPEPH